MSKQPNHGPGRRPQERRAQGRVSNDLTLSANDRKIAGSDLPVDNVLIDWAMVILVCPFIWGVAAWLPFPDCCACFMGDPEPPSEEGDGRALGTQPAHFFFFPRTCTHTPPRAPSHLCFALLSPSFSQGTGWARGVGGSPVVAAAPGIMGVFRPSRDSRLVETPGPVAMVFLLPPSRPISRASPLLARRSDRSFRRLRRRGCGVKALARAVPSIVLKPRRWWCL